MLEVVILGIVKISLAKIGGMRSIKAIGEDVSAGVSQDTDNSIRALVQEIAEIGIPWNDSDDGAHYLGRIKVLKYRLNQNTLGVDFMVCRF